ncbi:MAG: lysophospholipid acyltransferase family protein [Chloroflexota bacterium]|nr:lysophospholipid acyltransferase family protein [Chloroflexota bacterium]
MTTGCSDRPLRGADLRAQAIVGAYRLAVALAARVPPRVAYPVLDAAGDFVYRASPGARRAVMANLARVMASRPRRHRARAARLVFRHALRNYYDTFRLPAMSVAEIADFVPIVGAEYVEAGLAAGRGVIVVTAHVSSLVVGAQALAQRFGGASVVVEPLDPPELLDLMLAVRASHHLKMLPLGPRLAVDLAAALRRNELVFLAVDRDFGAASLRIPFFGAPAPIPTGPALLALRTGAVLLSAFVSRRPDSRLQGVVDPPIPIVLTGSLRADVTRITEAVAGRLEYHIGRYPEQWTVLQPVWGSVGTDGTADHSRTTGESGGARRAAVATDTTDEGRRAR